MAIHRRHMTEHPEEILPWINVINRHACRATRVLHTDEAICHITGRIGLRAAIIADAHHLHTGIGLHPLHHAAQVGLHRSRVRLRHLIGGIAFRQGGHPQHVGIVNRTARREAAVVELHKEIVHHIPRHTEHQDQLHEDADVAPPRVDQLFRRMYPIFHNLFSPLILSLTTPRSASAQPAMPGSSPKADSTQSRPQGRSRRPTD